MPDSPPPPASSNLSNNPYLALARSPVFFPYPLFYPSYYPPQNNIPPPSDPAPLPPAKQKRLKTHTVTTKSFSIPMVPRDKLGSPMLPLNVGIMTVIKLGSVCVRNHFHTERYIFPVGYEVTRRYLSTIDPSSEVVYHCTILDGGDGPKFQIIPSDRHDKPVIAGTATGAWSSIVKQANAIRNRQHSNSVSGPDFFGLGQNTIKHLIQELPNADKLKDYVWQNFVEGGPLGGRHAAVIPALPEEYDSSLPIGAYYPRKNDATESSNLPRGLSYYPQHIIAQAAEAQRTSTPPEEPPLAGPSTPTKKKVDLLIQEYRPERAPTQSLRAKRVTRSSTAAGSGSVTKAAKTKSSTSRQTRSTKKRPPRTTTTAKSSNSSTASADADADAARNHEQVMMTP